MNNPLSQLAQVGGQPAEQESPIFRSLRIVDDRMKELSDTTNNLQNRLTPILTEQKPTPPETTEEAKRVSGTVVEERLLQICLRIEGNISFQQNLINRLQI